MKSIVAIVHPETLGPVQSALYALGVEQMNVSQVLVRAPERTSKLIYRSTTLRVPFETRVRLEVLVEEHQIDAVASALMREGFVGEVDPIATGRLTIRPCAAQSAVLAEQLD